ncbi:hypothetical protein D3C85_1381110 [compost metagenome]
MPEGWLRGRCEVMLPARLKSPQLRPASSVWPVIRASSILTCNPSVADLLAIRLSIRLSNTITLK